MSVENVEVPQFGVKDVVKAILSLFKPHSKLPKVPPTLILTGSQLRPGLSPRKITSRIIARQAEAGAYMGDMPDGSENVTEKMELIRLEELIYALHNETRVDVVVRPGQQIDGTFVGVGSGYIKGMTITNGTGHALIR